jgi:hypothetical protein
VKSSIKECGKKYVSRLPKKPSIFGNKGGNNLRNVTRFCATAVSLTIKMAGGKKGNDAKRNSHVRINRLIFRLW